MPQIHEFSAPEGLGLKPSNLGTDATAQAARRVTSLYSETAESQKGTGASIGRGIAAVGEAADKVAAHMEISHGSQGFSSLMAAKTKEWEDASKNADPNDPTVAQKFLENSLEPELEKFKSGGFLTEKGQQWAEHHVESFRQHMYNKTAADMSSLAGQAVLENSKKTINNLANSVWNDPSKSNLDFAIDTLKSSTDGVVDSSPNLRGVDAGKARTGLMLQGTEALVKSAAQSHISKTAQMPEWLSDPKYSSYIKPGEMQALLKQEQAQRKMNMYYERATAQFDKAQQTEAAKVAHSKNWTENVKFDADGKATINPEFFPNTQKIEERYPGATTSESKAMINWGQAQLRERKEVITDDPQTHSDLMTRMFSADNPTTRVQILTEAANNKLSPHTTSVLLQLHGALEERPLKGPIWNDTMHAVKSEMVLNVPGIPGRDITGEGNYAKFIQSFIPQYLAKERAGTLEPNALDIKDPNSMISKAMSPFKRSATDRMRDYVNTAGGLNPSNLGGGSPPRPIGQPPAVGDVLDGYRFKGGDPKNRDSWEKVK